MRTTPPGSRPAETAGRNAHGCAGRSAAGRQILWIDARSHRTSYTWDAADRRTGRCYPDGSRMTFAYDPAGNRTLMHDGTGRSTSTFDALDRRTTAMTPGERTITYAYDELGQRRNMLDPDGGRFTYSYDAVGQIDHLVNPQGDRTSYAYDEAGRPIWKKLANGTRASFTYDAASQLIMLANRKSDGTAISSFDYQYDSVGNRARVVESSGDYVTWTYDASGQLLGERRSGASAYAQTFSYDPAGNRTFKDKDRSGRRIRTIPRISSPAAWPHPARRRMRSTRTATRNLS